MVILLGTLSCLAGFFFLPIDGSDPRSVILIVALAFGSIVGVCTLVSSLFTHIDQLGRIRAGPDRINAAHDRLDGLKASVSDVLSGQLNEELLVRANNDNPVAGIVGSMDRAVRNIEHEVLRVTNAKERIAARNVGPLSFIVSMYGEE